MLSLCGDLFDPSSMAPRWMSGVASLSLLSREWPPIGADAAVWSAFATWLLMLVFCLLRRTDRPVACTAWLFGAVALTCGTVLAVGSVLHWRSAEVFAGLAMPGTLLASWGSVVALLPMLSAVYSFRTPAELEEMVQRRTMELQELTHRLQQEVEIRTRIARELEQKESGFRLALRAGRMGTWDWELATGALAMDPVELELTGLGAVPDHNRIEALFQQVEPEDLETLRTAIQEAIDRRQEFNHEFRVRHPRLGTRWLAGRGEVEFDASGQAVRMRGVHFDITDSRMARQKLSENEAYLRSLLDSSADSIKVLDRQGHVLSMNRSGLEALEIDDFEMVRGRAWQSFWPEERRADTESALQAARTGSVGRFRGVRRTLKGKLKNWDVILTSIGSASEASGRLLCISRDITELVDLSRAREESEDRFRMVADNISQFAWMTDPTGAAIWFNQRWFEYTGTAFEHVKGWGWTKVHHPQHVDRVVKKLRRCFEAGADWEDTFPLRGMEGSYRWFLSRARVMRDGEGQVVGWFGTNTDITNQLNAEKALSRAHAQLKAIVDAAADAIVTVDDRGLILSANSAAKQIFGYDPEELAERPIDDFIEMEPLRRAAAGPESASIQRTPIVLGKGHEAVGRKKDGTMFPIEVSFSKSGLGSRKFYTGIIRDISERKRTEEILRIRLRAIEFATNGILITDALADDNPIIYANPAFEELTGYRLDEVLGKNPRFLQGKETSAAQVEIIREAIKNRHECRATILNYRKDGSRYWNDLHIAPVEDEQGRVTNFVGIQSDITSRIRYEQRLRESQEQANSANRAKSEFLANMSHEIRTPLTAILGCADSLFRQLEDPEPKDVVRMIRNQGQLLLGILNDVLDLSKIEAGKLEIHIEQFDLIRIIGDVFSLMHSQAVEKGIELRIAYRSAIPEKIRSDPLRLRQILLNLVSNALKFTEKGFVEIQLSCRYESGGVTLKIAVEDTGIGIPQHRIHSIFEAFTQEKSRLAPRLQGTGLGLTICQRLVRMLGGTIAATSQEGVGSQFVVELSLGEIDPTLIKNPDEITRTAALRDSQMVLEFFIPCRVLIAEDTRGIQFMMTRMLQGVVTSVAVAENGEEAIAAVAQAEKDGRPFDVILMDMQMPIMNGFEATRKLRESGKAIPIIALTAGAMAGDRENCLAAGCTDYLTKPIDRVELLAMLGHYCEA